MSGLRPRRLGHVGRVPAHGFVLDPEVLTEAGARARILAMWRPGAVLRRARGRYVLLQSNPVWVRAEAAPGAPLVRIEGRLSACALDPDELEAVPEVGALVLIEGGQAILHDVAHLDPVDPAAWIDLAGYETPEVQALGAPPPPPAPPPEPPARDLRTLADLPEAAPEVRSLQAALRGEEAEPWPEAPDEKMGWRALWARLRGEKGGDGEDAERGPGVWARLRAAFGAGGGEASARGPGLWARLRAAFGSASDDAASGAPGEAAAAAPARPGLFARFAAGLGRLFGAGGGAEGSAPSETSSEVEAPPGPPPGPSALGTWLRGLFARFAFRTRLARVLGRRQARYLQELLDLLDDGDLEDALRRAIPLRDEAGNPLQPPSFGVPSPRDRLSVDLGPKASGGGGIVLGEDLFETLRQHYRRAFDRLVALGRIEEAAFVLADLLDETDRAVSFLESHQRFALAAELAEARALPVPRRVRQWLLAGETDRAISLAKRHDAFAAAIALLERGHPELARQLRLRWADALADRGDFGAAVEAIWSIEDARRLAHKWVDAGLEQAGPPAGQLLARALHLMPERFDAWRALAERWWADPSSDGTWRRAELAAGLRKTPWSAQVGLLAVGTARALLRDADEGRLYDTSTLRALVDAAQDPLLRADWPGAPAGRPPFAASLDVLRVEVPSTDGGTLPVHDAVALPKGRTLVALGEAGARVLTRDGRTVRHFDEPAHHLVVSDFGHRALAVARRGRASRVARLDLVHQRASFWCDLELDAFARTFDGWTWMISHRGALTALDATEARVVEQWRNRDCSPTAIFRDSKHLVVEHERPDEDELWRFEARDGTLRARTPIPFPERVGRVRTGMPNALGHLPYLARALRVDVEDTEWEEGTIESRATVGVTGTMQRHHPLELPPAARLLELAQLGPWTLLVTAEVDAAVVRLVRIEDGALRVRVALEGAEVAGARGDPSRLLVFDDRGRVLWIDLSRGVLERSLRVRA